MLVFAMGEDVLEQGVDSYDVGELFGYLLTVDTFVHGEGNHVEGKLSGDLLLGDEIQLHLKKYAEIDSHFLENDGDGNVWENPFFLSEMYIKL